MFNRSIAALLVVTWLSSPAVAVPPSTQPAKTTSTAATKDTSSIPQAFTGPAGGFAKDVKVGRSDRVAVTALKNDKAWFHLSVPPKYTPEQAWPLVIVLHGGPGGNGPDDVVSFFRGGLTANGVINVYPNGIEKKLLEWNYPHSGAYLLAIIRQVSATYRVDPRRIYLVGVSMGGGGTWANGAVMPQVWAGLGPISGWYGAVPLPPAGGLKGIPIYCLHGEKDAAVPVERSRLAREELKKVGHTILDLKDLNQLRNADQASTIYREVPGAPHDVFQPWEKQGRAELGIMLAWLTAQQRQAPADLDAAEKSLQAWGKAAFKWTADGGLGRYE